MGMRVVSDDQAETVESRAAEHLQSVVRGLGFGAAPAGEVELRSLGRVDP